MSINLLGSLSLVLKKHPDKTIKDFFYEWQKLIGWDQEEDYQIFNQGVILTHLYGLIVYPKNVFHRDIPKIKLKDIDKKSWGDYEFKSLPKEKVEIFGEEKIITDENELSLEFLIRKIRNSLSHANFKVSEDMEF